MPETPVEAAPIDWEAHRLPPPDQWCRRLRERLWLIERAARHQLPHGNYSPEKHRTLKDPNLSILSAAGNICRAADNRDSYVWRGVAERCQKELDIWETYFPREERLVSPGGNLQMDL